MDEIATSSLLASGLLAMTDKPISSRDYKLYSFEPEGFE
jgi:hypothetical protein